MFFVSTFAGSRVLSSVRLPEAVWSVLFAFQYSDTHWDENAIFSILIATVFAFSTLNILRLVTKRFDHRPGSLNLGEILALTAMALSVCFLGLEMVHVFHIFPIKLEH